MEITESARRHQVSDADIRHAIENPILVFDLGDEAVILIGPATNALLLEVGVRDDRVFHAMPARQKFLKHLR